MMYLRRISLLDLFFFCVLLVFVFMVGDAVRARGGRDLKVGLFSVVQTLERKSPYDNPTDPKRPLFRYAPAYAILLRPLLLKSRMVAPFEFEDIMPSVFVWYGLNLLFLIGSFLFLLRLGSSASWEQRGRHLKVSILLALPLIGYELANSQTKLLALFFMLASVLLFEKERIYWSALSFSLALTVYVALLPFLLYFLIRKIRYAGAFFLAAFLVFFVMPSLFWGVSYNNYLLGEWFLRCLKPFFMTHSYETYIDLRTSSQALPSAIGRFFVSGHTGAYAFHLAPSAIHLIIKAAEALILLVSGLAVLRALRTKRTVKRGLAYSAFLILAMVLPMYCLYYTWSWLFVIYFFVLEYAFHPEVAPRGKAALLSFLAVLFVASLSIGLHFCNHLSTLFWATMAMWGALIVILWQRQGSFGT